MIKRYVVRAAAQGPFEGEVPGETIRTLAKNFLPNAARRMTHLGLLLGEALKTFPIEPDDAVIYATTFGETVATGRYLESFPAASPLFFQTSIHPSAIEQVLINRGCPVRELTPLAGQPDLSAQAALTALLTPGKRVLLTGGEEVGTWLRQLDAASNVGFGFALELGDVDAADGAIGELSWSGKRAEGCGRNSDDRAARVLGGGGGFARIVLGGARAADIALRQPSGGRDPADVGWGNSSQRLARSNQVRDGLPLRHAIHPIESVQTDFQLRVQRRNLLQVVGTRFFAIVRQPDVPRGG